MMIEIKDVSFTYSSGEKENNLSDISLSVQDGQFVLLCGESGCGKTTVTRLINGLIPHYYEGELKGKVLVDGREISTQALYETSKLVGSVFQNPRSQFFNVDTDSELAFGAENQGIAADEIEKRVEHTVREFRIGSLMGRNIFHLSGGEKQKIACASVAVCETPVLILDEPSSNLDVAAIRELRLLLEKWKSEGKTILIAEHRLFFLRDLADRVVYMKEGRIEKDISMDELKAMPAKEAADMGLRPLFLNDLASKAHALPGMGNITLNNFSYRYKERGQDFLEISRETVPEGAIIAIIGNNGAGKSTFAKCLCGLERKAGGSVSLDGETLKGKRLLKKCFLVMQDVNHQLFTESVLEEVLLSLESGSETEAAKILSGLDLLPEKELHPLSLSGGQKQRVAIASAVASKRDIIIFDEPTSGLDLRHMKEVAQNFISLNRQGHTLFIITHDLELILECCTHVLHFENGRVIENYTVDRTGEDKLKHFFAM